MGSTTLDTAQASIIQQHAASLGLTPADLPAPAPPAPGQLPLNVAQIIQQHAAANGMSVAPINNPVASAAVSSPDDLACDENGHCQRFVRQVVQQSSSAYNPYFADTATETMGNFKKAGIGKAYTPGQPLAPGELLYSARMGGQSGHAVVVGPDGQPFGTSPMPLSKVDWVVPSPTSQVSAAQSRLIQNHAASMGATVQPVPPTIPNNGNTFNLAGDISPIFGNGTPQQAASGTGIASPGPTLGPAAARLGSSANDLIKQYNMEPAGSPYRARMVAQGFISDPSNNTPVTGIPHDYGNTAPVNGAQISEAAPETLGRSIAGNLARLGQGAMSDIVNLIQTSPPAVAAKLIQHEVANMRAGKPPDVGAATGAMGEAFGVPQAPQSSGTPGEYMDPTTDASGVPGAIAGVVPGGNLLRAAGPAAAYDNTTTGGRVLGAFEDAPISTAANLLMLRQGAHGEAPEPQAPAEPNAPALSTRTAVLEAHNANIIANIVQNHPDMTPQQVAPFMPGMPVEKIAAIMEGAKPQVQPSNAPSSSVESPSDELPTVARPIQQPAETQAPAIAPSAPVTRAAFHPRTAEDLESALVASGTDPKTASAQATAMHAMAETAVSANPAKYPDTATFYAKNFPTLTVGHEDFPGGTATVETPPVPARLPESQNAKPNVAVTTPDVAAPIFPSGTRFHGSSAPVDLRQPYELDQTRNLFGPGFYTTDNMQVATGYTKKGAGSTPSVYTVKWTGDHPANMLDLDQKLPPDAEKVLVDSVGPDHGYTGIEDDIKNAPNGRAAYNVLKDGWMSDGLTTDEAQEAMHSVADNLAEKGYDGLSHTGGAGKGPGKVPHNVQIYFHPRDPYTGKPNLELTDAKGQVAVPEAATQAVTPPAPPRVAAAAVEHAAGVSPQGTLFQRPAGYNDTNGNAAENASPGSEIHSEGTGRVEPSPRTAQPSSAYPVTDQQVSKALRNESQFSGPATQAGHYLLDHPRLSSSRLMRTPTASLFIDTDGTVHVLKPHTHEEVSRNVMRAVGTPDVPNESPGHDAWIQSLMAHSGVIHAQLNPDGVGVSAEMTHSPTQAQIKAISDLHYSTRAQRFSGDLARDNKPLGRTSPTLPDFVNAVNTHTQRHPLPQVSPKLDTDTLYQRSDPTQTPEFKRFFAGSKVVDANGNPAVVYHGAPDARFVKDTGVFQTREQKGAQWLIPEARARADAEAAHWFTDSPRMARTYADDKRAFDYQNAEPASVPAYLSLKNPKVIDMQGAHWHGSRDAVASAKASGHDGVIIRNVVDDHETNAKSKPGNVYVAFKSEQIKHATDNRGTFDPNDPNILHQGIEGRPRGAVDFAADGSHIVHLLKNSNASTFIHEAAHVIARNVLEGKSLSDVEDVIGGKIGTWSRAQHERFATAFESYIMKGVSPVAKLKAAFAVMRDAMIRVYAGVKNSPVPVDIDPRLSSVFDRLFGKEMEAQKAERAAKSNEPLTGARTLGEHGFNVSRSGGTEEDQSRLREVSQATAKDIEEQRRGVRTWAQTRQAAKSLGADFQHFEKMQPGTALNPEGLRSLRELRLHYQQAAKAARVEAAYDPTAENKATVDDLTEKETHLVKVEHGAVAEAARSLQSLQDEPEAHRPITPTEKDLFHTLPEDKLPSPPRGVNYRSRLVRRATDFSHNTIVPADRMADLKRTINRDPDPCPVA
jgi:ADP-Ribosyltransferase in polyvalent proteins